MGFQSHTFTWIRPRDWELQEAIDLQNLLSIGSCVTGKSEKEPIVYQQSINSLLLVVHR